MATHRARIDLANGLGVLVSLLLAGLLAQLAVAGRDRAPLFAPGVGARQTSQPATIVDSSGRAIPIRNYRRIASASMVADPILLELCEPDRIVAFSAHAGRIHDAHRFAGKPQVDQDIRAESVVALRPDLLIVNNLARIETLQRLRESGITVFDLGDMNGVESLLEDIGTIGRLVGRSESAARLAARFVRRMKSIAPAIPNAERPGAMYVGIHGGLLTGGTRGTSFHDILVHAGFRDVAAEAYQGWPSLGAEQILAVDPEVIVTHEGSGAVLCRQEGLARLRACARPGGIVELPIDLVLDPGLAMAEAAERLHRGYFGSR